VIIGFDCGPNHACEPGRAGKVAHEVLLVLIPRFL
jgi:hypothetical protein